jgi:anti-sigma regulatory factor (Ser/Thr protein kinase)
VHEVAAPPGPPLGIGFGQYEDLVVPFPPGTLLVAYTDGLVESRTRHVEDGIADLVELLRGLSLTAPVEEIADELLGMAHGLDDTALVVLRYLPPTGDSMRLDRSVSTLDEIAEARHAVITAVGTRLPGSTDAVAVVLTELLSNAVQHAGPPVRLRLLVTGDRVLIEVRDTSTLRPRRRAPSPHEDRGRGLHIVDALATDWGFRITRDGKSTWAELHDRAHRR